MSDYAYILLILAAFHFIVSIANNRLRTAAIFTVNIFATFAVALVFVLL